MSVLYLSSTIHSAGDEIAVSIFTFLLRLAIMCVPLGVIFVFLYERFRQAKSKQKTLGAALVTQLLELAHAKGGTLTIPEVSMNTDLSLEESEQVLDSLVKRNFVNLRVSKSGAVLYDFPRIA
jgi:hypothetical protein